MSANDLLELVLSSSLLVAVIRDHALVSSLYLVPCIRTRRLLWCSFSRWVAVTLVSEADPIVPAHTTITCDLPRMMDARIKGDNP
jgi:hypothetical protein